MDFKPKLDILRDHGKSKRHLDKAPLQNMNIRALPFRPVNVIPVQVKKLELKLAVMTVCHLSFNSVDHISEILKEEGAGSNFEKIKLHRTKERAKNKYLKINTPCLYYVFFYKYR
jgi:hypothetical protein